VLLPGDAYGFVSVAVVDRGTDAAKDFAAQRAPFAAAGQASAVTGVGDESFLVTGPEGQGICFVRRANLVLSFSAIAPGQASQAVVLARAGVRRLRS
jgi:hypothetical protein